MPNRLVCLDSCQALHVACQPYLVRLTAGEAPAALRRQLELLYQSILVVVTGGAGLKCFMFFLCVCAGCGFPALWVADTKQSGSCCDLRLHLAGIEELLQRSASYDVHQLLSRASTCSCISQALKSL
jgi:hypothetical protein